jgi:hypothetical protein
LRKVFDSGGLWLDSIVFGGRIVNAVVLFVGGGCQVFKANSRSLSGMTTRTATPKAKAKAGEY